MTSMFSIKQASGTNLATFLNALHAADPFGDVDAVLEVATDHHKWEAEYAKWQSLGKPLGEDDPNFEQWAEYVVAVNMGDASDEDEEETVAGDSDDSSEEKDGEVTVTVSTDDGPDVTVTADPAVLWEKYGTELTEDGMEGKSSEEVIRHVYEQNPDAPELTITSD